VTGELVAAADLDAGYAACRDVHRRHGTTYFWATRVLPARQRPHVHALYAYCRYADEIVDELGDAPVAARRAALDAFRAQTLDALATGTSADPLLAAFAHTVAHLGIDTEPVERFLNSMTMDLDVTTYATWDDLLGYMDGSAAVVGEMMLPVLEPTDVAAAFEPARDLGLAFQLTNFLRDVGEDLDRGRVYLPQEDLDRFSADPWSRRVTPAWRQLMEFEIARARSLYASADRGIEWLPPRSAACVRAARVLYSRILLEIERNGYDVFATRARVSTPRKLVTAARYLGGGAIGSRKP
jgi:phytoene/squalene synthetase